MDQTLIIFPAIAMFFLTIGLIFFMGFSRFRAIQSGKISIKYYRKYNEGHQPDALHILGRHVQNHFEVPPLFYAGVLITLVVDVVTPLALYAAWAYFGFRCLHTVIHLSSNNVTHRFLCFGASLIALTVLWVSILLELL